LARNDQRKKHLGTIDKRDSHEDFSQFWESPEVINLEEKNHEEQYQQNQFDTTKQQR